MVCKERSSVVGIVLINKKFKHIRVDKCIRHLPTVLSVYGFYVVACCCGHGRYPLTVVCKNEAKELNNYFDLISGKDIPRRKRFYKRDKDGYFYIPEVSDSLSLNTKRLI